MAYIIDGHNLIGKIPGIDLSDLEDELKLIEILQEFSRITRKRIEVYFDKAPPGYSGKRRYGMVTGIFVQQGNTADQVIIARIRSIGKAAPNWTVVSSDHMVQNTARRFRAKVISSSDFVKALQKVHQITENDKHIDEKTLTDDELDYWLKVFNKKSIRKNDN